MAERSKSEMLVRMDSGLREFLIVIDGWSEEQMTGPVDSIGWNVRDHLTHLAVWADGIAALAQSRDRWAAMGLDMEDPDHEPDYDELNAAIVTRHRHLTAAEARAWLLRAHNAAVAVVESMDDEQLTRPYDRFVAPFTGERGHPISEYILGNTEDHYEEHTPWVRAIVGDHP